MKQEKVLFKAGILLLSLLLVLELLVCDKTSEPIATQTPVKTITLTPAPHEGVIYLQAPESAVSLWNQWNGRYVIYAHRNAGIETLGDLNGKVLLIAFIEVGTNDILGDAQQFLEACGISMNFAIQNNPDVYSGNLLENNNRVGFMISGVADYYGFDENQELIRIEFQE